MAFTFFPRCLTEVSVGRAIIYKVVATMKTTSNYFPFLECICAEKTTNN